MIRIQTLTRMLLLAVTLASFSSARAVDYHWTGLANNGQWSSAANWDLGVPVGPGNGVFLDAANGWSVITITNSDDVLVPDTVFGPEWGATLNVYGKMRSGGFIVSVQATATPRSVINVFSNATISASGMLLGDSWWYHGGPYVTMNLYGNAQVSVNELYWGGRLNLFDSSVFVVTNSVTVQTLGLVSDATRRINLAGGTLVLPGGYSAQVTNWIARGLIAVEDLSPEVAQISVMETNAAWPGRTVVTANYPQQMHAPLPFYGDFSLHDPGKLIKEGTNYFLFGTGTGILAKKSSDLRNWTAAYSVFSNAPPAWTTNNIVGFDGFFWAPDIAYFNGRYNLYYSCSVWGTINSAIGLVTTPSLSSPVWTDQGKVIESNYPSTPNTDLTAYNCIDPSILVTTNGSVWMSFGSYSDGILIMQLDPTTGKRISANSPIYRVANNGPAFFSNTEEGSFLYQRGGFYYLFVNFGSCCSGMDSTYNVRVGRSTNVFGPFFDANGVSMTNSGGTMVLESSGRFIGPGHPSVVNDNGTNWMTYHYYDGLANGFPRVGMSRLYWTADGWPAVTNDWSALYSFNTDARDHLGLFNGSLLGGATIVTETGRGKVLNLNGTSAHVQLPAAVANAKTFATWVTWNGGSAWQRIFDFHRDTTNYCFLSPRAANGVMRFAINTNSAAGNEQVIDAPFALPTNSWCHVAVTVDGSRGTMYLNGNPIATNNSMTVLPWRMIPKTNYLGRSAWAADPYFSGRLSSFRIFGRALGASEIGELARAHPALAHRYSFTRNGRDSIGMAHGELLGSATVVSNALKLPGTANSYVNLPGGLVSGSAAVTVEFWSKFGVNGVGAQVVDFGNTAGFGFQYLAFSPHTSSSGQRLELVGSSTTVLDMTGTLDNRNVSVAFTVDPTGNFAAVYTNGVLQKSSVAVWAPLSSVSSAWSFIGRSMWSSDAWLNGTIDELRIYDGRLTPQEIAANYKFGPDVIATPVSLTVASAGGNVVLSWPSYAGYGLESIGEFGQTWTPVNAAPALVNNQWQVTVPASSDAQFFRLRLQ